MTGPRRGSALPFTPLTPPPDRGALMTPVEVAALIGGVSPGWVRRHIPHKVRLGQRTVRWYRRDVEAWLEAQRAKAD